MIYPESLASLFALVGILLKIELFRADGRARWGLAVALGVTIGLGLLTKLSPLMFLGTASIGALMELVRVGPGPRQVGRLIPFVAGFSALLTVAGWYYARNVRLHGRPFLSGYEYHVNASFPFQRVFGQAVSRPPHAGVLRRLVEQHLRIPVLPVGALALPARADREYLRRLLQL